jgi:hypothetical protein
MRCHFKSSNSDWTRFQVLAFWSNCADLKSSPVLSDLKYYLNSLTRKISLYPVPCSVIICRFYIPCHSKICYFAVSFFIYKDIPCGQIPMDYLQIKGTHECNLLNDNQPRIPRRFREKNIIALSYYIEIRASAQGCLGRTRNNNRVEWRVQFWAYACNGAKETKTMHSCVVTPCTDIKELWRSISQVLNEQRFPIIYEVDVFHQVTSFKDKRLM